MRILLFLLFPVFLSAQINRAYGVIEIGATFPTSSSTGPKFAYRPADSSFYRWSHGSTWVKVVESSITSDTLFLTDELGTTVKVSGDTINLTPYLLKSDTTSMLVRYIERGDTASMLTNYPSTAGYGIIDGGKTWRADTTSPNGLATRLFTKTLPTTIAANYAAVSNGTNLVARNLFDNNTYAGVIGRPWKFGEYTTASLPTGVNGYWLYNTDIGPGWYDGTRWNYVPKSSISTFTSTYIPYTNTSGQFTQSANLTYTGTRFQTGGSIRIGYNNASNDTASIEKVIDVNSKIIRFNAPGGPGNFGGGFVFRGGQNGTINTANTFRIYAPGTTASGSVFVGNVTEPAAQAGNPTTIFGILNKITSTTAYDAAINVHPNETGAGANYSLALGKQLGIFIGNNYANTAFTTISGSGAFGVYIGYQRQPLTSGYGSSMVFSAKGEGASNVTEVMRLQGKDGNICLGCTNAQYKLYTASTNAYGIPSGTVAQRPTIIASTTPFRNNTDSIALEYGESVGVWRQIATRAYARSLVSGLPTTNIYTANGSLTADRTLHGAGYTLRFNANTIFRDSLKIGNLIESSDADSVVITKNGWIGKQKFLLKNYRDSLYTYGPNGFFSDKFASGFMSSRNRNTNLFYADTTGFLEISNRSRITNLTSALYLGVDNGGKYITLRSQNTGSINDFTVSQNGLDYSSLAFAKIFAVDSTGTVTAAGYGAGTAKTLGALGKTLRSALGVATDGTMVNIETKRDTTIYVVDADYDFSAALTTAQVASRYNRIIIHMTLTSGVGADKTTILHTPDANLMQCEILIRGTDNTGTYDNEIAFGTNNAISSDGTNASGYTLAQGQGLHVRVVYNGSAYKYIYY